MTRALQYLAEHLGFLLGVSVKAFFAAHGALIALRMWGLM